MRVHNGRGKLTLPLERSERMQPGLVAIPFGWWYAASPERRAVNALTNPAVPDDDQGFAAFCAPRTVDTDQPREPGQSGTGVLEANRSPSSMASVTVDFQKLPIASACITKPPTSGFGAAIFRPSGQPQVRH